MSVRACSLLIVVAMLSVGCESKAPPPPAAAAPVLPGVLLQGSLDDKAKGADDAQLRPAIIFGMEEKTEPLDATANWKRVPPYLSGLKVQRNPLQKTRNGEIDVRIESPGLMVVAVLRKKVTRFASRTAEYEPIAQEELVKQQWEQIAEIVQGEGKQDQSFLVFRRKVKPGELVRLSTQGLGLPSLIVLEQSRIQELAVAASIKPSLCEMSHLPMPPPFVGGVGQPHGESQLLLTSNEASQPTLVASLLQRELVRQSILIAARDELGLFTRDEVLGEIFPQVKEPAQRPLGVIVSQPQNSTRFLITVFRHGSVNYDVIWERELKLDAPIKLEKITTLCEEWSRSEFKTLLTANGWKSQLAPPTPEIKLPDNTEERLLKIGLLEQFALIRELHQARHTQGESVEMMWALARAYANLGTLTDYLWSPTCRAFQARALLYAERAWGKSPTDARAAWNRAYVRALIGLHAAALEDLAAADERLKQAGATPPAVPDWVGLMRPFCEFNRSELEAAENNKVLFQLACHLQLLSSTHMLSDQRRWKCAQRLLQQDPYALHGYFAFERCAPLGLHGAASQRLLPLTALWLVRELPELPGVPPEVSKLCEDLQDRAKTDQVTGLLAPAGPLLTALDTTDAAKAEATGIGWSALAHLTRELTFYAVLNRLRFERESLGVDAEPTLEAQASLVKGHPFAQYLNWVRRDPGAKLAAAKALMKSMRTDCLDLPTDEMLFWLRRQVDDPEKSETLMAYHRNHLDPVFRNLAEILLRYMTPDGVVPQFEPLKTVSPHSPALVIFQLRLHRKKQPHGEAADWEKKFAQEPDIQHLLGKMYIRAAQWEDAERCLKHELELSPNPSAAITLAGAYERQDNIDKAIETLEEALQQESLGLEHARVATSLAYMLMRKKRWQDALPHANEAAQSYSAWGLRCAQLCNEGLEKWSDAEALVRARAERYESSQMEWFFWCRRTGQGDAEAARQLAMDSMKLLPQDLPQSTAWDVLTYQVLTDQIDAACQTCKAAASRYRTGPLCLQMAVLELARGDKTQAAEWARQAELADWELDTEDGVWRKSLDKLSGKIMLYLKLDKASEFDEASLKRIGDEPGATYADMVQVHYFAGMVLWHTGHKDMAIPYLRKVAQERNDSFAHILATALLRKEKIAIEAEQIKTE